MRGGLGGGGGGGKGMGAGAVLGRCRESQMHAPVALGSPGSPGTDIDVKARRGKK